MVIFIGKKCCYGGFIDMFGSYFDENMGSGYVQSIALFLL